jgi:hypothetical protein
MNKMAITAGVLGLASILPIWRGAGHSCHDGVSFWRLLKDSTNDLKYGDFGHPHIPYDEAVARANEAYINAQS